MTTFANLAQAMKRLEREAIEEQEDTLKRAAKAALRTAFNKTPKDTFRSQSNWLVSLNRATRRQRTPQRVKEGTVAALAASAIPTGEGIIGRFKLRGGGGSIFIVNNTPYIEELDAGSSGQAPSGFSEFAVQTALTIAKSYKIGKF